MSTLNAKSGDGPKHEVTQEGTIQHNPNDMYGASGSETSEIVSKDTDSDTQEATQVEGSEKLDGYTEDGKPSLRLSILPRHNFPLVFWCGLRHRNNTC